MIEITLDNVPYKMDFTLKVYKEFRESTGKHFNLLAMCVMSELAQLEKLGVLADMDSYDVHHEVSKRVFEYWDLPEISCLFYLAAKACNSKVTLEEIEDYAYRQGISPDDGIQYKVIQFITYCLTAGGKDESKKKSSKPSLLKKLYQSLIQ